MAPFSAEVYFAREGCRKVLLGALARKSQREHFA
jgi:hypothetical protein